MTSNAPKKHEIELYVNGRCDVFAIALSEIIGGAIRVVVSTVGDLGNPDIEGDLDDEVNSR